MSASPEAQNVQKRAAKVNTNLRFGKTREALVEAYKLRLFIHTGAFVDPAIETELEAVEQAIARLESSRFGLHRRLAQSFLKGLYKLLIG